MQMQSTYWLQKVLKMISLYVNALLCTLQHIHDVFTEERSLKVCGRRDRRIYPLVTFICGAI